jgi:hypothetical protein
MEVYLFNNSTQIIIKISIDFYFDNTIALNLVDCNAFPYFDLQKRYLMFHHIKSRFAPRIEIDVAIASYILV